MSGNFSNEIWLKWKQFTAPKAPDAVYSWEDINWDWWEDILYMYGWKLYLWDIKTGNMIWETAVYDVFQFLWTESIKADGSKSIMVVLKNTSIHSPNSPIAVFDGKTGSIEWMSTTTSWASKLVGSDGTVYKKADLNADGVREYMFKTWYHKYFAYTFSLSGSIVAWQTYADSWWFWDYNSDGYQWNSYALWNILWKKIVATIGWDNYALYSHDLTGNPNTGIEKYKMPVFWRIGFGTVAWWNGQAYFYDFNWDGNDELITRTDEQESNGRKNTIFVAGLNSAWAITSYWSYSSPNFMSQWGTATSLSTPIPLKNPYAPTNSYLMTYMKDPADGVYKYVAFDYKWLNSSDSAFKTNFSQNESFNHKIAFTYNSSQWTPSWLFNNGLKDYVVLSQWSQFKFYTFTWSNSFNNDVSLKITWSYSSIASEINPSCNLDLTRPFCSVDTNGNGKPEFPVVDANHLKFYEINDAQVTLVNDFDLGNIPWVLKLGLTRDNKDIYAISYDSTKNTINYWRTKAVDGINILTKLTNDTFNATGLSSSILVSKIWWFNRVMLSVWWSFDARNANPSTPITKISNEYFNSWDSDKDGINEIDGNKTYVSPGVYTTKYAGNPVVWDFNGDGVLDYASFAVRDADVKDYLIVYDGKTGWQMIPDWYRGTSNGCWGCAWRTNMFWYDVDSDGKDELIYGNWYTSIAKISASWPTFLWTSWWASWSANALYDIDNDGKLERISAWFWDAKIVVNDLLSTGPVQKYSVWYQVTTSFNQWFNLSLWKDASNQKTYIAVKWTLWEVAVFNWWDGSLVFNSTYLNNKKYNNPQEIINTGLAYPIQHERIFLGDWLGDGTLSLVVTWWDGYIYILNMSWNIVKSYNIWSPIINSIVADTNEDGKLEIIVSASDWYVYDLTNSNLLPPSWVKDGQNYGFDIETQTDNKKATVNYANVTKATGYFVQLYNKTEKSTVFDWVNVGNKLKACIVSSDVVDSNCISAGKTFSLNGKSIYEWRVQSYNSNVTSPISISNGFSVLRLAMDKKVAKKEDLNFVDSLTVSPNTLLTYKITVVNDSLNTIGWAGFMNYDIMPAQAVTNCSWISDCRAKNVIISDYMPSTFTYMPNSTIWIVKKIKYDWSEEIVNWWSQVSDSYFKNQSGTKLITNPWANLAWEFPSTISIPPGWFLELQFDAIARQ